MFSDTSGSGGNFPSFSEGLSLRLGRSAGWELLRNDFPSFSEGLSLRRKNQAADNQAHNEFPFLVGGTFIEALVEILTSEAKIHFPSFSEGLSLRHD